MKWDSKSKFWREQNPYGGICEQKEEKKKKKARKK